MDLLKTFGITNSKPTHNIPLYLFNTLSGKKEIFEPLNKKKVLMYNCGPTVYDFIHIGNLRAYILADILRRTIEYNGYSIKQVINITDVGHLTSDADEGEDKIEKKARQEGKKAKDIANKVTKAFLNDIQQLNINTKEIIFPKATEHINEQIAFIKTLEEKGYTYKTKDGVYFDTSLFKNYGKLGKIDIEGLKEGARVQKNKEKKNLTDFALWKFSPPSGESEKRQQEWKSPWGVGFPGWHIECSAMSMKHLGKQFDIHTGGIDHIPIHHNNEIAQSESATGKQFVNYWLHNAFITIDGQKISKSIGNTILLRNITDKGFSPLAYRYWLLTAHYKTTINFTWDSLLGAQTALFKLHRYIIEELGTKKGAVNQNYQQKFHTYINNDLDTPKAIALLWELVKDKNVSNKDKRETMLDFDKVLGLGFKESSKRLLDMLSGGAKQLSTNSIPATVKKLIDEREDARKNKNWQKADEIRDEIHKRGYEIDDTDNGPKLTKLVL